MKTAKYDKTNQGCEKADFKVTYFTDSGEQIDSEIVKAYDRRQAEEIGQNTKNFKRPNVDYCLVIQVGKEI